MIYMGEYTARVRLVCMKEILRSRRAWGEKASSESRREKKKYRYLLRAEEPTS